MPFDRASRIARSEQSKERESPQTMSKAVWPTFSSKITVSCGNLSPRMIDRAGME
jgi:hypothetical protein